MIDTKKEQLNINKLIAEKRQIIEAEGDMIVPDSKPDVLNTICTSGVVSIYKKEAQNGRIRVDGTVNTYIMYIPDEENDTVRGLNTSIDFSENIDIDNCLEGMNVIACARIKSIDTKVINGRKIGIKATIELTLKIFSSEEIEVVNEINGENDIQFLKEDLKLNSLVGTGQTKISAKETIQLENGDNFGEMLKVQISILDKDVKISYNKILTKADIEIRLMYLTEENRIKTIVYKTPLVGFIDIPNVAEGNICDVNYQIKNVVIKPNSQEEHSIYVEVEVEVNANVYEEKQINLIQDLYSPTQNIKFVQKQITGISDKQNRTDVKQIREKVNLGNLDDLSLLDVDAFASITNENKINSKILYEAELNLRFIFKNSQNQIIIKEAKIPFEYILDNLQNGEELQTNCAMNIKNKDFIIQDGGDINCNVDLNTDTDLYRTAIVNVIDSIEDDGECDSPNYSLIIYIVQKGDTLWNIAKRFGSTIDGILSVNEIEDKDKIMPGQKLYIPKYERMVQNV